MPWRPQSPTGVDYDGLDIQNPAIRVVHSIVHGIAIRVVHRLSTHVEASWGRLDAHLPAVLVCLLLLGGWFDAHLLAVFVTCNTLTPDPLPSRVVGIYRRVVRPPRSLLSACSPPPTARGGRFGPKSARG